MVEVRRGLGRVHLVSKCGSVKFLKVKDGGRGTPFTSPTGSRDTRHLQRPPSTGSSPVSNNHRPTIDKAPTKQRLISAHLGLETQRHGLSDPTVGRRLQLVARVHAEDLRKEREGREGRKGRKGRREGKKKEGRKERKEGKEGRPVTEEEAPRTDVVGGATIRNQSTMASFFFFHMNSSKPSQITRACTEAHPPTPPMTASAAAAAEQREAQHLDSVAGLGQA